MLLSRGLLATRGIHYLWHCMDTSLSLYYTWAKVYWVFLCCGFFGSINSSSWELAPKRPGRGARSGGCHVTELPFVWFDLLDGLGLLC